MQRIISLLVQKEDAGATIYQFLKGKHVSSTLIRSLKKDGLIRHNGHSAYIHETLKDRDLIELYLPAENSDSLLSEKVHFEVLYEDEDLLIVNKPAGIAVHPTFNFASGTLANGVVHYWQSQGKLHRFRAINRLDKDTSGIVLIALNLYAYNRLAAQQENSEIIKKYLACVHGNVLKDEDEINRPIGRKLDSIIEREVRSDGQEAITRYKVINRWNSMTLLEVQLLTGRTHQIRVHMSYSGHPLVGDDLYGGIKGNIDRQALHAFSMEFVHPYSNKPMKIVAPLPKDFEQLLHDIHGRL